MAAIYQQARPSTFEQVVGQEHVKDVLVAALERGRIGHAYLFSGPRGVGKTTTARLLAMAVNCEREAKPCGACESCLLVRHGNHPDVVELDAASNNSVEDIRDLREKVRLAALRGGKRVWVLDEAHMLSKSAANALLKTLEEPPGGLIFILATTEPEKLPPTILSRCQHFRFRRLSDAEIAGKLGRLCEAAGVAADEEAVMLVARAADGAMRDAESLLERLLALGKVITRQDAENALGLPPKERLQALAEHLIAGELAALFEVARGLYGDGFAPRSLAEGLKATLRDALYSAVGVSDGFRLRAGERDLRRVIHALDDEDERFVRRDDLFSLEVALIKAVNALTHNLPKGAVAPAGAGTTPALAYTPEPLPDFEPTGHGASSLTRTQPQAPKTAFSTTAETPQPEAPKINWRDVMREAKQPLRAYLHDARHEIEGPHIYLSFQHDFHYKRAQEAQEELHELIAKLAGDGVNVHLFGPGEAVRKKL